MMKTELKWPQTLVRTREFLVSRYFMALEFLLACAITAFGFEIAGVVLFVLLISVLMVVCDDIMVTTLPFLLLSMFVIKCYGSYETFIEFWWLAFPVVFALGFHLIVYRQKLEIGKSFWGVVVVAIAVTFGGLGTISAKEYFNLASVYYTVGLGIGMILMYLIMNSQFKFRGNYLISHKFSVVMVLVAAFGCFMVLQHYLVNLSDVIGSRQMLTFQWRNNISTFLMLAMPFPFYMSMKRKRWRSSMIWLGALCYACILLSGSRGGTIFGGVEFVLCVGNLVYMDKKRRFVNILMFAAMLVIVGIFMDDLFVFFGATMDRMLDMDNDARVGLIQRALSDFKANPIFGMGLGYMGNTDVHNPAEFALCWYHSMPFQIVGSFGALGIVAYGYQLFTRLKIVLAKRTSFTATVFIAFLGLEMMSLVNPGEFCPLPYGLMATLFFILIEKCSSEDAIEFYNLKFHRVRDFATV